MIIKKTAYVISSILLSIYLLKKAPITANITEGIPMFRMSLLLIPFLKTANFEILLKIWNNAVIPKTEWKSKNRPAKGTKKSEEPKPPTVPRISESKAKKINKIRNSTLWLFYTNYVKLNNPFNIFQDYYKDTCFVFDSSLTKVRVDYAPKNAWSRKGVASY